MNKKLEENGLTRGDVEHFAEKLRQLRDRLSGEVDRELEGIREDLNAAGNLSSVPIHLGDAAPSQLDADITVMENERIILQQTHEAIERIAEGTYGGCQECGQPIARERLEELPFTPFCFNCASENERRSARRGGKPNINEARRIEFPGDGSPEHPASATGDRYAAGTPGGGAAAGGLGGTNAGHGDIEDLDVISAALGSGLDDQQDDWIDEGLADGEPPGKTSDGGRPAGNRPDSP